MEFYLKFLKTWIIRTILPCNMTTAVDWFDLFPEGERQTRKQN